MRTDIDELRLLAETNGHVNLDADNIEVSLLSNVEISGDAGTTNVGMGNIISAARTAEEVNQMLTGMCERLIRSKYEKLSTTTLRGYLYQFMKTYLNFDNVKAACVMLHSDNRKKFEDIITRALDKYLAMLQENREKAEERSYKNYEWEVPETRDYNEQSHTVAEDSPAHAMQPFIRKRQQSGPESRFESYLNSHSDKIAWWYKNGDEGKQHFAIPYIKSEGKKSLFYVDYIIRMNDGRIYLFDTKSAGSDHEAPNKHNALVKYMHEANNQGANLVGGVIIEDNGIWRYCRHEIGNTTSFDSWGKLML